MGKDNLRHPKLPLTVEGPWEHMEGDAERDSHTILDRGEIKKIGKNAVGGHPLKRYKASEN